MSAEDEFSSVRRDPDPITRGRRATELLTLYQQRATELARLRRAAIEEAHHDRGMSYTDIATALGITKGRVTQIRASAPAPERAFFGVGPVSVGVPYRYTTTDRERPLIAAEDARAGELMEQLLRDLGFEVGRFEIDPDQTELPEGDVVVICGPKSAPVAARLLKEDPALALVEKAGRWFVEVNGSRRSLDSPSDNDPAEGFDLAYVARHRFDDHSLVHVAGIHAIGSLGAVHYLTAHLGDTFRDAGNGSCSFVVRAQYEGLEIARSELAAGPFKWR